MYRIHTEGLVKKGIIGIKEETEMAGVNKKRQVICFSIHKGGVGKTESTCAFAQVLGMAGYRCLIIDLDCQKNTTRIFGAESDVSFVNYQDLLLAELEKEEIRKYCKKTKFQGVDIIPATSELFGIEDILFTAATKYSLKEVLSCFKANVDLLRKQYDYILMDTHPDLGRLNKCAIAASDLVLCPMNTDARSMDALNDQVDFIRSVNTTMLTEQTQIGVFFARIKERTTVSKTFLDSAKTGLRDLYIPFPISECQPAAKAAAMRAPLFDIYPKCKTAVDYIRLVVCLGLIDKKHVQNVIAYRGKQSEAWIMGKEE